MNRKKYAHLVGIENRIDLNWNTSAEFMFQLESGLLLALREDGILTQMQYRYAEQKLKLQQHSQAPKRGDV